MSEMVRADHFELDVRPAAASTEWVMQLLSCATRFVPLDPEEDRTALSCLC